MTHVQKETAVLLKEKGFDVEVRNMYFGSGTNAEDGGLDNYNKYKTIWISAPTHQEATEWLRVKGVHVVALPQYQSCKWIYRVYNVSSNLEIWHQEMRDMVNFPTHDLALEAGIIHALKYLP